MSNTSTTYHHGNLRRELMDSALKLIEEKNDFNFTMRELARKAQVTHNAPYRHFADKTELLASLAEEGFVCMQTRLQNTSGECECAVEQFRPTKPQALI